MAEAEELEVFDLMDLKTFQLLVVSHIQSQLELVELVEQMILQHHLHQTQERLTVQVVEKALSLRLLLLAVEAEVLQVLMVLTEDQAAVAVKLLLADQETLRAYHRLKETTVVIQLQELAATLVAEELEL